MHFINQEEINNHINSFKFNNYTFEERLNFIFLYRIVYTVCAKFNVQSQYYPLVLFQDPYKEWNFILVFLKQQKLNRNSFQELFLHKLSYSIVIGLEITEGSKFYYGFNTFRKILDQKLNHLTFYDIADQPFDNFDIYRHIFQALRHVDKHKEESKSEWANTLHNKGFFPITDELTDKFASTTLKDLVLYD